MINTILGYPSYHQQWGINMYFRLNPECFYIRGERCSAIYDVIDGEIYSLNSEEAKLIECSEKNQVVNNDELLFNELKGQCIGNFYQDKVHIEKIRLGSPIHEYQHGQPLVLDNVFLEINNSCNKSCWFCGFHGIHRSTGCMGCNIWNESGTGLKTEKWKEIIDELSDLECNSLYFTGGDLTLQWDRTLELLRHAHNRFPQIYIILNNQRCSEKILDEINNIACPIIQTDDKKVIKNSARYLLITSETQEIFDQQAELSPDIFVDFVSSDYSIMRNNSHIHLKKKIPKPNILRFTNNRKKHPCLANTIAISWKGDIFPCPLMRKFPLGTVRNQRLFEIFRDNKEDIEKFWNMNLDTIEKCKKCELRYACDDCRAIEETITGDLFGKYLCRYDPSKGIWV